MVNVKKLHNNNSPGPITYEIRIKGILDQKWTDWFGNFSIKSQPDGETVLTGQVVDQAALRGMVSQILNLNLELISVMRVKDKGAIRTK
jgi:hypothetical protein